MEKRFIWLLLAALLLSGCGREQVDRHPDWDAAWVRFDDHLAVETPDGFDLRDNNSLPIIGLFHSLWTSGECRSVPNADRTTVTAYDAQLELLLAEQDNEKAPKISISRWLSREKQLYQVGSKIKWKNGELSYTIYPLAEPTEDSPYIHGAVAFAACSRSAICAQLLCSDAFEGDAVEVLESFLTTVYFGEN